MHATGDSAGGSVGSWTAACPRISGEPGLTCLLPKITSRGAGDCTARTGVHAAGTSAA
jgi:hypothetical protein